MSGSWHALYTTIRGRFVANAALQHKLFHHDPPILHTTFLARMMWVVSVPALEERVAYFAPFVVFWDSAFMDPHIAGARTFCPSAFNLDEAGTH